MESTDLLAVQVTTRMRYGVRRGNETLKRRVAAKFTRVMWVGAVRELASAKSLAPQDGDTIRATLGSKRNRVISCWSFWRALSTFVRWKLLVRRKPLVRSALTDLVNVMVRSKIPQFAVSVLYGANECVIRKRDCGIMPIAVGSTIRRFSVKVGKRTVSQDLREKLRPVLGLNQWGMRGGSACGPTLCQWLLPQEGPSENRHA